MPFWSSRDRHPVMNMLNRGCRRAGDDGDPAQHHKDLPSPIDHRHKCGFCVFQPFPFCAIRNMRWPAIHNGFPTADGKVGFSLRVSARALIIGCVDQSTRNPHGRSSLRRSPASSRIISAASVGRTSGLLGNGGGAFRLNACIISRALEDISKREHMRV